MIYAVAALGFVNLLLTLLAIRWARRQVERLGSRPGAGMMLNRLPTGSKAPEFHGTTVTGAKVSLADLIGSRSAIGFFSRGCPPCHVQVPEFVRFAQTIPGGAAQVIAVVTVGDDLEREAIGDLVDDLSGVASVVVESVQGPIAAAFSVRGYPTFYAIDEAGRIQASGLAVNTLPATRQLA